MIAVDGNFDCAKKVRLETAINKFHIASQITGAAIADKPVIEKLEVTESCWNVIGLNPELLPRVKEEAD